MEYKDPELRAKHISEGKKPYTMPGIDPDMNFTTSGATELLVSAEPSDDVIQMCAAIAGLTQNQTKILIELSTDYLSSNTRSDVEIAEHLGYHRMTVLNARRNPRFAKALTAIILALAGAKVDKYIRGIEKAGEKDWRAYELMLKVLGVYIPKQQSLNISAKLEHPDQIGNFQDWIDDFCIKCGAAGYPIDEVVRRYHQLRSEGAF